MNIDGLMFENEPDGWCSGSDLTKRTYVELKSLKLNAVGAFFPLSDGIFQICAREKIDEKLVKRKHRAATEVVNSQIESKKLL